MDEMNHPSSEGESRETPSNPQTPKQPFPVKLVAIIATVCIVVVGLVALLTLIKPSDDSSSSCNHQWIEADCLYPKTCRMCQETTGTAKGHSFVNATCTEPKICQNCNKTDGKALGHAEVVDAYVKPTCTAEGKTEGKHCSRCMETIVAQTVIDKLGHVEVVDSAVAPTCTSDGKTEGKHCSTCKKTIVVQNVIKASGHTEVVDPAIEATCEVEGKTAGKHCSVCEKTLIQQTTISKLEHDYIFYTCSRCKKENVPDQGLTFGLLNNGTYSVSIGSATQLSTIVIPSTYNGCEVTQVNHIESSSLKTIVFPNTIKLLIWGYTCENLVDVYYNGTINDWCNILLAGDSPLVDADNLYVKDLNGNYSQPTKVVLDNIGGWSLYGCDFIEEIVVLEGVKTIPGEAISYCTNLTKVSLPSTLTEIDFAAFYACKSLEEIVIPKNTTTIDIMAFGLCSNLKRIIFENPSGWSRENWGTFTPISSSDFSNPSIAAEIIVSKHPNYTFLCW